MSEALKEVVRNFVLGCLPEQVKVVGANNAGEKFDCKLKSYGNIDGLINMLLYNRPLALKLILPDGKELQVF